MHFLYIHTKNSSYDIPWTLLEMKEQLSIYEPYDFDPNVYAEEELYKLEQFLLTEHFDCLISFLYIPGVSELCQKYNLKYIGWIFDSPLISLFHPSVQNSCNYLFLFDRSEYERMRTWDIPHLYYLPMGTNVSRTGALNITAEDEQTYACDVSFVGSLYTDNPYDKFIHALPADIADEFKSYLIQHLCVWSAPKPWPRISQKAVRYLTQAFDPAHWDHQQMDLDLFLGISLLSRKLSEMDRITVLNALSEQHSVHLYTNSDCSCLQEYLQHVHMHHGVNYHTDMNKIFYLSKINLNITLSSIETGLPQRIFDIMGAGGFLLTNYQQEIEEYFTVGKDLEVFHNIEELKEKTAYYLSHERERLKITINGYKKVREHFSYQHQMAKILETVKEAKI